MLPDVCERQNMLGTGVEAEMSLLREKFVCHNLNTEEAVDRKVKLFLLLVENSSQYFYNLVARRGIVNYLVKFILAT